MYLKWVPFKRYESARTEPSYDIGSSVEEIKCRHSRQISCHKISFVFKRRFKLYLMTVYFPSWLIVLTSFVSFWIDPTAVPARVTLSVTSLLALMTQMISVRNSIPNVNYVTAIDVWFLVCTTFVALSIFEYALIHTFISKSKGSKRNISNVFPFLGREIIREKRCNWNIDSLSKILFPSLFSAYIMVYALAFAFCAPK